MNYMERRRQCERYFRQFNDDYKRMNTQVSKHTEEQNKLYRLEGQLTAAQAALDQIVTRIKDISRSGISCGVTRNPKDCVSVLADLAISEAKHKHILAELRALVRRQRQVVKTLNLDIRQLESAIASVQSSMSRNGCEAFSFL